MSKKNEGFDCEKSSFAAIVLDTVSMFLFALGM